MDLPHLLLTRSGQPDFTVTDAEAKAWQRFMEGEEARRRAETIARLWRAVMAVGAIALAGLAFLFSEYYSI